MSTGGNALLDSSTGKLLSSQTPAPDVSSATGILPIVNGGTGLSSGTSGGVLGFIGSGTLASSSALGTNELLLGGGAGATPVSLGSLGTTTQVLHGNAGGAPLFGSVSLTADVSGVLPIVNGGTSGNTAASARSNISAAISGANNDITSLSALSTPLSVSQGGTGDTTLTSHGVLIGNGSSAIASTSVGATGTVLHGNTGGDPSFSTVLLTADVSGTLPIANGGTSATNAEDARINIGAIGVLATVTGINGKLTGATTLYTPSGHSAVVTDCIARITAATALSGTLNAGIGSNVTQDNIFSARAMTGFNAVNEVYSFSASGVRAEVPSGTPIQLGIDSAFGGTSVTLAFDLIGYLI